MHQSVSVPKSTIFPQRKALAAELPGVFGVTEEAGCTDIGVYNIRVWELPEADFNSFMEE